MRSPSSPAETADPEEDTQFYRDACRDLVELGLDLARRTQAQPVTPQHAPLQTLAFERIARAIRRTILLAEHLGQPRPDASLAGPERASPTEPGNRPEKKSPAQTGTVERQRVETLASDRREVSDMKRDVATRPLSEIIAEIRRDLTSAPEPGPHPPTQPPTQPPTPPPSAPPRPFRPLPAPEQGPRPSHPNPPHPFSPFRAAAGPAAGSPFSQGPAPRSTSLSRNTAYLRSLPIPGARPIPVLQALDPRPPLPPGPNRRKKRSR